jgi:type VI secretion system Hcp family effector
MYVTIEGVTQGWISDDCLSSDSVGILSEEEHKNKIKVNEFNNIIIFDGDIKNHLTFIKPLDKSSALLCKAIDKNEKLNCTFYSYRENKNGIIEHYYTTTLKNAYITSIESNYDNSSMNESISLKYESIFEEYHIFEKISSNTKNEVNTNNL